MTKIDCATIVIFFIIIIVIAIGIYINLGNLLRLISVLKTDNPEKFGSGYSGGTNNNNNNENNNNEKYDCDAENNELITDLYVDPNTENYLIVDVANLYTPWYSESRTGKKVKPGLHSQDMVMTNYVKMIEDHYKEFTKIETNKKAIVWYVIKNHICRNKNDKLKESITALFEKMVKKYNGKVLVAFAVDYSLPKEDKHYEKGRDDYLCFLLAKYLKTKFKNVTIMSNDMYKDFDDFGKVPGFCGIFIYINDKSEVVTKNNRYITRKNLLGQIRDYKMVKLTLAFDFSDKFTKTNTYKIGDKVW